MQVRSRKFRWAAALSAVGLVAAAGVGTALGNGYGGHEDEGKGRDHIFVIMLENHSQSSVIDNANAPYITSLAHTYGMAANYYGITHPSLPNYVGAISGSNWFVNDDNPANRFDHTNLVDQLEASHHSWAAYMETMPSAGFTGDQYPADAALYVSKHNPFVLFDDIRNNPNPARQDQAVHVDSRPTSRRARSPTSSGSAPTSVTTCMGASTVMQLYPDIRATCVQKLPPPADRARTATPRMTPTMRRSSRRPMTS